MPQTQGQSIHKNYTNSSILASTTSHQHSFDYVMVSRGNNLLFYLVSATLLLTQLSKVAYSSSSSKRRRALLKHVTHKGLSSLRSPCAYLPITHKNLRMMAYKWQELHTSGLKRLQPLRQRARRFTPPIDACWRLWRRGQRLSLGSIRKAAWRLVKFKIAI